MNNILLQTAPSMQSNWLCQIQWKVCLEMEGWTQDQRTKKKHAPNVALSPWSARVNGTFCFQDEPQGSSSLSGRAVEAVLASARVWAPDRSTNKICWDPSVWNFNSKRIFFVEKLKKNRMSFHWLVQFLTYKHLLLLEKIVVFPVIHSQLEVEHSLKYFDACFVDGVVSHCFGEFNFIFDGIDCTK